MKTITFISKLTAIATAAWISTPLVSAAWKNYQAADAIIGRQALPSPGTLHRPSGVAVNPLSGKIYVSDTGHHRVLRYSSAAAMANGQPAEAAFGQPDLNTGEAVVVNETNGGTLRNPANITVDPSGNLWVCDSGNHRILRWADADNLTSGASADQVIGQANFTSRSSQISASSLYSPNSLKVDDSGRLWVADSSNHRVLRFDNAAGKGNGPAADGVIGQADFTSRVAGTTSNSFNTPHDVVIDSQGRLWVADGFNSRILRFDTPALQNQPAADAVLGQPDFTSKVIETGPATMRYVYNIQITPGGSLFALDGGSFRILRWDNAANLANGADAHGVLGRTGLTSNAGYAPALTISGLAMGPTGALWCCDYQGERALRWNDAVNKPNGAAVDGVIGQPDTSTTLASVYDPTIAAWSPRDGFEDPVSGKFFIADYARVLRFSSRKSAENGEPAEAVLGKLNTTTYNSSGSASATNLRDAWGLAMDSAGKLWVSDPSAHRVVAFADAVNAQTGATMAVVLGQSDFTSSTSALAQNRMHTTRGIRIDAGGSLYVADYGNHRVLRFDNIVSKISGAAADAVIGQADFITASTDLAPERLKNPSGLCFDSEGRLWIADTGRNRVVRHDNPAALTPLTPPSGTLGGVASYGTTGMSGPTSVAVTSNGRLWVMDAGFNRVLRFENAATKPNSPPADGALGVVGPGINLHTEPGRTLRVFNRPNCLFLDIRESLWVSDQSNARILNFIPKSSALITHSGLNAGQQFELTFTALDPGTYNVRSSTDLKNWTPETSYQLAAGESRTFTQSKNGTKRFFRIEEP